MEDGREANFEDDFLAEESNGPIREHILSIVLSMLERKDPLVAEQSLRPRGIYLAFLNHAQKDYQPGCRALAIQGLKLWFELYEDSSKW